MTPRTLALSVFLVLVGACAGWTLPIDPGEPDPPAEPPPEPPNPPPAPEPEIYLADADGSNARLLTAGSRPSWSPDGKQILYVRSAEIQLIDADDSLVTSLGPGEEPAWAPDGRAIGFTSHRFTSLPAIGS
jgi:Tol biopolymer transport system component